MSKQMTAAGFVRTLEYKHNGRVVSLSALTVRNNNIETERE